MSSTGSWTGSHVLILRKKVGEKVVPATGQGRGSGGHHAEPGGGPQHELREHQRFVPVSRGQLATAGSFADFPGRGHAPAARTRRRLGGVRAASPAPAIIRSIWHIPANPSPDPGNARLLTIPTSADTTESAVFKSGQPSIVEYLRAAPVPHAPLQTAGRQRMRLPGAGFKINALGVMTVLCAGRNPGFNAAQVKIVVVVAAVHRHRAHDRSAPGATPGTTAGQTRTRNRGRNPADSSCRVRSPNCPERASSAFPRPRARSGGDYFDVIPVEGHGVLVAIADVMGKGMPAALLATILRAAIRARLAPGGHAGFFADRDESANQIRSRAVGYVHHGAGGVFSLSRQQDRHGNGRTLPYFEIFTRQPAAHADARRRRAARA